jgi:ABC-type branched-subunit amino acid transport system substrate-binding protein
LIITETVDGLWVPTTSGLGKTTEYFSVGDTDFGSLVDQIVADRPDFIFTTLIGESGYAFFRQLRERKNAAGLDPCRLPVASCSLSEVELPLIGDAAAGHLSSSVYFSTTQSAENARFTKSWDQRFGHLGHACAGSAGFEEVRAAVRGMQFVAPQGLVTVDPENLHCWMRPRIGRSTTNGDFELIFEADRPIRPDPYLVWVNGLESTAQRMVDNLRVVR